jgi:phosphohistidine phosphatase
MDLILWRHADAEPGEPDEKRRLTAKGKKQARRAAEWLHSSLPNSARILVSPAVRAQQTAAFLAELSHRKLKTVPELAPGASAEEILQIVEWPDAAGCVVVVGHQPALGWVASRLLANKELPWSIKKAGIWWLQQRGAESPTEISLRAVVNPDLL